MSDLKNTPKNQSQQGSALVIAILVMLLLMGFVVLAISRTTSEMMITSNDSSESRTYAATEASLESTTRDFVDVFEKKLSPDLSDIGSIQKKKVPGFDNYTFAQKIEKIKDAAPVVLAGGNYSGLYALRDSWEIDSTATETGSGVKVQLKRRFFSDRIPIYQFGMFFEDDLELNRPPLFTFGGRVHTNGNFFVTGNAGAGIYFNSKVSAVGEIINDIWKPGTALANGADNQGYVFINDASGKRQELKTGEGSVNCAKVNQGILTPAILAKCTKNTKWDTQKAKFQGNLENNVARLNLPLTKMGIDLVELVRRGKNVGDLQNVGGSTVAVTDETKDSDIIAKERFANKTGIRISLADSQKKLPGCANAAAGSNCGIQLDAALAGTTSIGYQPLAMTDGYKTTALNATRIAMKNRETWIKIETVSSDNSAPVVKDITADILSLGMTEPAPTGIDLQINGYLDTLFNGDWTDTRSIIKMQRFAIPGNAIPSATAYTSNYTLNGKAQNLVVRYSNVTAKPTTGCTGCTAVNPYAAPAPDASAFSSQSQEDAAHLKWANIKNSGFVYAIVPFPIEMFDSREGLPNDNQAEANTNFGTGNVPSSGVMSLVDIDVANLRRFLNGDFDGKFPTNTAYASANGKALKSSDVPIADGWVVYFSDRRGDYDFDGAYDMEDIFPDGVLQSNEDLNKNGTLDLDLGREAPASYTTAVSRGQAATADHLYYRRGVRLINASVLPGNYDAANPANTKGFTFASENGVYVKGNYNATGAGSPSGTSVTPPENYSPQNSSTHVPASIAGDAVIILSNNWNDAQSFIYPFSSNDRVASDTVVRFAMLAGDAVTGDKSTAYSPSQFGQLNGGVHNFKRFLEKWTDKRLNYSGSLINLFNSQNNNGFQKCCTVVYSPPIRDWTFDPSFLNINRLPPGTPFIYSISFTGFQRVND
jgi:hypothetical protein